jgi:hypothetical protein
MQIIPASDFLAWSAEAGLMPDPRYRGAQQLVYPNCPDCWGGWDLPRGPGEPTKFVGTVISLVGDGALRIRMRGGGVFGSAIADSERERVLRAATLAAGIPPDTRGAIIIDPAEHQVLRDLAAEFLSFGYCVGTDLEIVTADRGACLMLSHHYELLGHFASRDRLSAFDMAMIAVGYGDQDDDSD